MKFFNESTDFISCLQSEKRMRAQTASIAASATWGDALTFILASVGATYGLAGLWRFPYLVTHHGGASFIFAYLVFLFGISIPLAVSEILIGRSSPYHSPVLSVSFVAKNSKASANWRWMGRFSLVSGVVVLALYSVVGGMSLAYIFFMALGEFDGGSSLMVVGKLYRFQHSAETLTFWQTLFLIIVTLVVSRGVQKGIAKAVKLLIPLMMLLLVALLFYVRELPSYPKILNQMLEVNRPLTLEDGLEALSQAFFTLSLGLGVMMVYGAYLPKKVSVIKSMLWVALVDVILSVLAGLIVYTVTTSSGLKQDSGFSLLFKVLPQAFGSLPQGQFWGTAFFIVVCFASWSSALSVMEPTVAHYVERFNLKRWQASWGLFVLVWAIGFLALLSFNLLSDVKLAGQSLFAILSAAVSIFLIPVVAILLALFVGRIVKPGLLQKSLNLKESRHADFLRFFIGIIIPPIVVLAFAWGLIGFGSRVCLLTASQDNICVKVTTLHSSF